MRLLKIPKIIKIMKAMNDGLSCPDSKRSTGHAGVGDKRGQIHLFLILFERALLLFFLIGFSPLGEIDFKNSSKYYVCK